LFKQLRHRISTAAERWIFLREYDPQAPSTLIMFVFAQIMPARTIAGARAREATLGFREFLGRVDEERMKKMITSPQTFERFLPFAMAFGVADKWAKAFEDMYREPPT
jgi:hypothetical protein